MLIWPVLALLLVLLFYKRDVTPPWNPVIQPPQPPQPPQEWPPQLRQPELRQPSSQALQSRQASQAPQTAASATSADAAPTRQSTSGFTGGFTPPPPVDLNEVFRRPRS